MKYTTIKDKLCCPFDKSELSFDAITIDKVTENVIEGILTCKTCKRTYPIISGIPIMVPDEYRESSLEQPLLKKWQTQIANKNIENLNLINK